MHSDRGSAMKSDTLAQLLAVPGASQSFSRLHVSDDNAFREAHFKTLKYQPDYPGRFSGVLPARGWLGSFFAWFPSWISRSRCLVGLTNSASDIRLEALILEEAAAAAQASVPGTSRAVTCVRLPGPCRRAKRPACAELGRQVARLNAPDGRLGRN